MRSESSSKSLRDVIEFVIDNRGRNPSSYKTEGIPVIDNYLITSAGKVDLNNVKRFIDEETYSSFLRKYIQEDDILMTLVGNGYGKVAITPKDRCAIIQNTIGLRCNSYNSNRFLYYLLCENRNLLTNLNRGAAQPSIKVGDVLEVKFEFPSLSTQKKIAHILSTLDDKIELNRKMNETLEAMAQALFKSWFVDFDPVHARAKATSDAELETAAKELGISREVLELFPGTFVESEIGMVPEGWEVIKFEDIASVRKGLSYKGKHKSKNKDDTPMFNLGNFGRSGQFRPEKITYYNGDYKERHLIRSGQLMIANTDMTQDRIILGLPLFVPKLVEGDMIFTHHVFAIDFKNIELESKLKYYIFYTFLNPKFREIAEGYATGTTVLALPKDGVMKFNLLLASEKVIEAFNDVVHSLVEKMIINKKEIQTLQKTRDTLLPKLLSGELDVSGIEIKE